MPAPAGVRAMSVQPFVRMHVDMEEPAAPADQEPDGESGDENTDRGLCALLDGLGKIGLEEHDRDAEREQARRMAEPPRRSESRGGLGRTLLGPGDERRHCREMVRIGCVS